MGKNSIGLPEFKDPVCEEFPDGTYKWICRAEKPPTACRKCGCVGPFGVNDHVKSLVADQLHHGRRSYLEVDKVRYLCPHCGKTFVESFDCIDERARTTVRLRKEIELRSIDIAQSFTKIAKDYNLTGTTVRRIFDDFAEANADLFKLPTPHAIGLDEAHLYGEMRLVMADVEHNRLMDIYHGREDRIVTLALKALPDKGKIRVVTIDMWRPYLNCAKAVLPSVKVVVDRFHVIQALVRSMDTVRKETVPRGTTAEHRSSISLAELMKMNREALTDNEYEQMKYFFDKFPAVRIAYYLKEGMRRIYRETDRDRAGRMYVALRKSVPPDLTPMEGTFRNMDSWSEHIFNFFDEDALRLTNAYTESENRILKEIKQAGRAINFETLRRKAILYDRFKTPTKEKSKKTIKYKELDSELSLTTKMFTMEDIKC